MAGLPVLATMRACAVVTSSWRANECMRLCCPRAVQMYMQTLCVLMQFMETAGAVFLGGSVSSTISGGGNAAPRLGYHNLWHKLRGMPRLKRSTAAGQLLPLQLPNSAGRSVQTTRLPTTPNCLAVHLRHSAALAFVLLMSTATRPLLLL